MKRMFFHQKDENKNLSNFSHGLVYLISGISIIVLTICVGYVISTPKDVQKEVPTLQLPSFSPPPLPEPEKLDPEKLFNEAIKPAIRKCRESNQQVLRDCIDTLKERLQDCYAGIDPFLEDLTSFKTKFGIVWNWATADKEVYVQKKFEKYIFSEEKLNQIVSDVVSQYMEGISANLNNMYLDIKEGVEPIMKEFDIPKEQIDAFVKNSFESALEDVKRNANRVLWNAVTSYLGAEVGFWIMNSGAFVIARATAPSIASALSTITQSILTPALATAGVNISASLLGSGTGITASTATGASIGSVVPGVGTIIGFLGGLAVGYLIQESLDTSFRSKMRPIITSSIDEIRKQVENSFRTQLSETEEEYMNNLAVQMKKEVERFCNEKNLASQMKYTQQLLQMYAIRGTNI